MTFLLGLFIGAVLGVILAVVLAACVTSGRLSREDEAHAR